MTASPRYTATTGTRAPLSKRRRAFDFIANPVAFVLFWPALFVMGMIGWAGLAWRWMAFNDGVKK